MKKPDVRCLCGACLKPYLDMGYRIKPIPVPREECDKCDNLGFTIQLIEPPKRNGKRV